MIAPSPRTALCRVVAVAAAVLCGCIDAQDILTPSGQLQQVASFKAGSRIHFTRDGHSIVATTLQDQHGMAYGAGVFLYDVTTGTRMREFQVDRKPPLYVCAVSHDGHLLAAAGGPIVDFGLEWSYHPVIIWDLATGRELRRLEAGTSMDIIDLDLSPDGEQVAFIGRYGNPWIWNWKKSDTSINFEVGYLSNFRTVQYSPDGRRLLFNPLALYDLAAGTMVSVSGYRGTGEEMTFTADGRMLGCGENRVGMIDPASGKGLGYIEESGDASTITLKKIVASDDSRYFATADEGGDIRVYRLTDGGLIGMVHAGPPVTSLCFSPDGSSIAAANASTQVTIWSIIE